MEQPSRRQIRVFVSSTFRDMQAERDYLVKFIFPQLRRLCEQRGVIWSEVDLRWGITDEQSSEGQVLPICLAEIERCRPYFIGLLGERYGWIPDAIAPELVEREPWLAECRQRSVTELEIMHGVLNNPDMASQALFYFRDPAFIRAVDEIQRQDFVESPWREDVARYGMDEAQERVAERNARLAALKGRIRSSGLPLRENYCDPQQLGAWLLEDVSAIIDRLFPEGSQPDPLQQEALEHEAFAASRARIYVGGQHYFARLDVHAREGQEPLVVLGESGAGKSALLANWALEYRAAHPEELVLVHFIGATAGSVDWAAMVRRIMAELQARLDIPGEIPDDPEKLRSEFPNWLHMAGARGKAVLVVDALNQLEDRQGAQELTWLPPALPENVRVVFSTLPGKSLAAVQERGWPTLVVQPLSLEEREQLVWDYLAQYAKQLSLERVQRIVAGAQSANPLALRMLLEELRQFGVHERLDEFIDRYLAAATIPELFALILARCEADYEGERPGLVRDALRHLWAARRGLAEAELLDLLGSDGQPLPRRIWSPLYLALEQSFLDRGGLLGFFHDYIRQAVEHRYLAAADARTQAHITLADYFASMAGQPPRRVDELPWQLARAGHWPRLYDLLADLDFFQALYDQSRYDLLAYWAAVESASGRTRVDAYRPVIDNPGRFDLHVLHRLGAIFRDTGCLEEAMALAKEQERRCRQQGNLDGLAESLRAQAVILRDWGKLEEAMALLKEKERISRQLDNMEGLGTSLGDQAVILLYWGKLEEAMALLEEQERICRQFGNLDGIQRSLGNQAWILDNWGKLEEAMALLKEKERICRQLGNLDGLRISLGNQALTLRHQGKPGEAMALQQENERICRQLGNLDGLQYSLGNQAVILYYWGRLEEAMALYKEQERICRQLESPNTLHRPLGNQALILRAWGRLEEAMALAKEQERICRRLENLDGLQLSLGTQADILRDWDRLEEAMALQQEKERICRQLGKLKSLQSSLGDQATIMRDWGRLEEAMVLLQEQERLCRQMGDLNSLQGSLGSQALILHAWGRLEEAMALLKEQERLCRQVGSLAGLQEALDQQAGILQAWGRREEAAALRQEMADLRPAKSPGERSGE